jgi:hypothetical protein
MESVLSKLLLGPGTRLLAVVVVMCVMVVLVRGCPPDRAKMIGRTSQDVRTAYGEPDSDDERSPAAWVGLPNAGRGE